MVIIVLGFACLALVLLAIRGSRDDNPGTVLDGGCAPSSSPFLAPDPQLASGRISYCAKRDADSAFITSSTFAPGTRSILMLVAGYPNNGDIRLEAHSLVDHRPYLVELPRAGDTWRLTSLQIPEPASRDGFTLRLVDQSTKPFGWAGLGVPTETSIWPALQVAGAMALVVLAAHAWLCMTAWLLPVAWPQRDRIIGALLALGLTSTAIFFLYLGVNSIAPIASMAMLLAPAAALAVRRPRRMADMGELLDLSRMALPSAILCLLILWVGLYPFPGTGDDWHVAAFRWRAMPADNWLSYLLGEMARGGTVTRPLFTDWLSSDRPPLLAGTYLLFRHVLPSGAGLAYQAISTWAQCLVLIPLAMLLGRDLPAAAKGLMLGCLGLSALVMVHGLFVWPKLIAAAYCAIFHLALFSKPASARQVATAGIAAALAMLAHGGALFALAGSAGAFVLLRRAGSIRVMAMVLSVSALLYAPWIYYQRFVDPPGNRLLKWHFAGESVVSGTSLSTALVNAYSQLPLSQWIAGRLGNVTMLMQKSWQFPADAWQLVRSPYHLEAAQTIVERSFFYLFHSLWFFSPWLILPCVAILLARRRPVAAALPPGAAWAVVIGLAFWCMVMFKPSSTGIHQGAYFTFLLLTVMVMRLTAAVNRPLFFLLAGLNIFVCISVYMLDRPLSSMPHGTAYTLTALALTLAFLCSCVVALRAGALTLESSTGGGPST